MSERLLDLPFMPFLSYRMPIAVQQAQGLCVKLHRSFRSASTPEESKPKPPNSQKLPLLSIQPTACSRAPGALPMAGMPCVP